jgi:hypothetical protein
MILIKEKMNFLLKKIDLLYIHFFHFVKQTLPTNLYQIYSKPREFHPYFVWAIKFFFQLFN